MKKSFFIFIFLYILNLNLAIAEDINIPESNPSNTELSEQKPQINSREKFQNNRQEKSFRRTERREDRRENRTERREDRRENRTERREDRRENRTERREDRNEQRIENRGTKMPEINQGQQPSDLQESHRFNRR